MSILDDRTQDICDQLTRYGGAVFNAELLDVLSLITDINDDMHHMRHTDLVKAKIEETKLALDRLSASL